MKYFSNTGKELRIHVHATDSTCHWASVLKPLAFIAFYDVKISEALKRSPCFTGMPLDLTSYTAWLGITGKNGLLNLLNVFIVVYELRGSPSFL
jgi:hypothetical protein